jgi:hypothetical protein
MLHPFWRDHWGEVLSIRDAVGVDSFFRFAGFPDVVDLPAGAPEAALASFAPVVALASAVVSFPAVLSALFALPSGWPPSSLIPLR